jgi:hypothetical protein
MSRTDQPRDPRRPAPTAGEGPVAGDLSSSLINVVRKAVLVVGVVLVGRR